MSLFTDNYHKKWLPKLRKIFQTSIFIFYVPNVPLDEKMHFVVIINALKFYGYIIYITTNFKLVSIFRYFLIDILIKTMLIANIF